MYGQPEGYSGQETTGASQSRPKALDLPPDVQARLWLEHPVKILEAGMAACGDIFVLELGAFGTIVIVAMPEGVRQVFELSADIFECRHFNESYRYVMGDYALFLQDGARHRKLKQMLARHFREASLVGHERVVAAETKIALEAVTDQREVQLRPLTHRISLGCLLKLTLGKRMYARERILRLFEDNVWRDLRAWKPWTMLSRIRPELLDILSSELAVRRSEPNDHDDLLARLADESSSGLPDEVIKDQIIMLTITAGDAVAVAAAWALYHLGRQQDELGQRLREERIQAKGASNAGARPYLHAACKEVLRLHPVLPTVSGRKLLEPINFMGFEMAAGITLAPCEYLVHRRADIFEDPLAFRPERHLTQTYAPYEYFPFGGANRACLGSSLAPMTIRSVLDTAAEIATVEQISPEEATVVRHGTLLAPFEGHSVHIRVRENQ